MATRRERKRKEKEEKASARLAAEANIDQFAVSQATNDAARQAIEESFDFSTLKIDNFNISAGGKELFHNAHLTIVRGKRYGLLGPNGMGKTTLLKHLAERKLVIPKALDVLLVEQEQNPGDQTVLDAVLSADVKRLELLQEEKKILETVEGNEERLKEVYDELTLNSAESAEAKARKILHGLGFEMNSMKRALKEFSGGWRMRVSLARALFMQPSLLLLDEPTNHLDLNAVIWLDDYLQKWKKMLLIVSHDQDFIDSVCTDILHLEDKKVNLYHGDIYTFKRLHKQKKLEDIKAWEKQEKRLRELKKKGGQSKKQAEKTVLKTQKAKGKGRGKGNDKQAVPDDDGAPAQLIKRPPKDYSVTFSFPSPPEVSPPILEMIDVHFRYSEKHPVIFDKLDMGVGLDTRISIVGPNGVGKSTLLDLMMEKLDPTSGEVRVNRKVRIGRYNQHFIDQLPMEKSPVEYLQGTYNASYQDCRNLLGKFGLIGHAHTIPMRDLSGGQKSRVVFASLHLIKPHLIILDEPTNHLDMESIDALIKAIKDFEGGVVVVTHDARLIKKCECQLWVVGNRDCKKFAGGFDEYRDYILEELDTPQA